jgi:hypothetical protein
MSKVINKSSLFLVEKNFFCASKEGKDNVGTKETSKK